MITLEFSRAPTITGALIRAATWSEWDHVSLVMNNAKLLSAMPMGGVWVRYRDPRCTIQRFTVDAPPTVYGFAKDQLDKPYDWTAVLGIGLHRDWREADSWFCSELIAWVFERAGVPLLRADHINRITPGMLAMSPLLSPVEG